MFLKNGKPRIRIDSLSPNHGPSTGDTKVLVRGGPFASYQQEHPEPVCRFGDAKVAATYVQCAAEKTHPREMELGHRMRTSLCIQCENSPRLNKDETVNVTF